MRIVNAGKSVVAAAHRRLSSGFKALVHDGEHARSLSADGEPEPRY
jgi:hypothetical protein